MPEALPASRPSRLAWYWRELRVGIPVPVLAAWFFSSLFGDPFLPTLVYALCIGILIQLQIEAGRYGLSYRRRQRCPDDISAQHNWPGWHVMAPLVAVASLGAYFPGHALGDLILGVQRPAGSIFYHPRAIKLILVLVILIAASFTYFLYMRGRMAILDARTQAAIRSAAENQLKLLESQLEPHMLFNTLANLRVMIGIDPPQAQAMLDHLSAFLRAMLEASRTGSHPLEAEFARIADYLELMQIRMGPRLLHRLDLPPELAGLPVPPLLLQPLVENAIKHGLEPQVSGGRIDVAARRDGAVLVLSVRDSGAGPGALPGAGTSFGLQQVRARLAALYGSGAVFARPAADGGGALAIVRLPISPEPRP
jgi:signal transduction histidine kinase